MRLHRWTVEQASVCLLKVSSYTFCSHWLLINKKSLKLHFNAFLLLVKSCGERAGDRFEPRCVCLWTHTA